MPVISINCPSCGARINKSINFDKSYIEKSQEVWVEDEESDEVKGHLEYEKISVECPRCKKTFNYSTNNVDDRTKKSIAEYYEGLNELDDNSRFEEYVLDDGGDSVEEALNAVTEEFKEAASEFDSEVDTDIPQIDFERAISDDKIDDLMSVLSSKVRSRVGSNNKYVDHAFDKAEEFGSQKAKEKYREFSEQYADKMGAVHPVNALDYLFDNER